MFDTLIVFMKEFLEKDYFEQNRADDNKSMKKYPACKRVNLLSMTPVNCYQAGYFFMKYILSKLCPIKIKDTILKQVLASRKPVFGVCQQQRRRPACVQHSLISPFVILLYMYLNLLLATFHFSM